MRITLETSQSWCRLLISTSNRWLTLDDCCTLAGMVTILVPQFHHILFGPLETRLVTLYCLLASTYELVTYLLLWKINHCFSFLFLSLHRRRGNLTRAKTTSLDLSDMESQTWVKPQPNSFLKQVQYANFCRNYSLITIERIFVNKSPRFVWVPYLEIITVPAATASWHL